MPENLPVPLTQAEAQSLAADIDQAICGVVDAWVHSGHDRAVVLRELEHVLRRAAVDVAPRRTPSGNGAP